VGTFDCRAKPSDSITPVKLLFDFTFSEQCIRGRGRTRLRWINDVEDNLRKLGVKRWRTKALDREEWASIIREAKAKLKGRSAIGGEGGGRRRRRRKRRMHRDTYA
jgi:hypothetical protein